MQHIVCFVMGTVHHSLTSCGPSLCPAHRHPRGSSALGLIVNVIVLWNTIYMDAALRQLRKEGFGVRDEDVARLSPLGHENINMLGRYAFSLSDRIARGELRPLRNPALLDEAA